MMRRAGRWAAIVAWSAVALAPAAFAMERNVRAEQAGARYGLVNFDTAPFPFSGNVPADGKPFLDVTNGGRRGHTSPRGGVLFQDEAYWDKRVLLSLSPGFDPSRQPALVVFFHGNNATLERDVVGRQQVVRQFARAGLNAALVAPQFAINALDSSAGKFWEKGAFSEFLKEASEKLAAFAGDANLQRVFDAAPVVLVAYSGGYNPAAYALTVGGASQRVHGVVLLDALYGEVDLFAKWIIGHRNTFFVSAYSATSKGQNEALKERVAAAGISTRTGGLDTSLVDRGVFFLPALGAVHNDFVTQGWTSMPMQNVLSRVVSFASSGAARRPATQPSAPLRQDDDDQPAARPVRPVQGDESRPERTSGGQRPAAPPAVQKRPKPPASAKPKPGAPDEGAPTDRGPSEATQPPPIPAEPLRGAPDPAGR